MSSLSPSNSGKSRVTRRMFIGAATSATAAFAATESPHTGDAAGGTGAENQRQHQAFRIRVDAAILERDAVQSNHLTNGDEQGFVTKIGNFSKGLPHNTLGEVDPNAY